MENFPTEILVDILSRLDLQNLLECRLVSSQ